MGRPIKSCPEPEEHWLSATLNGSDIKGEDGRAAGLTRRTNVGWGLVILFTLAGFLTAGYTLGILGDLGELRPSLTKIVKSFAGGSNTDITDQVDSIDSSARKFEASSSSKGESADTISRAVVAVPVEVAGSTTAEASARIEVERLTWLLETSEAIWAEGHNAERERSDGIAKDLASVRAELADRVTAEASARTEVAQMTKLLEAKETEWTKRIDAERESSAGLAKDLATVRAELTDRVTAEASARTEVAQMTKLLEAKETEWTKRIDAERESSAGLAKDLASVRAELANRVTAEASARTEVAQMTKLLEAKETEWTKRIDAERESSAGLAKDLASVRAELANRVTAEASARTTNDLTTNIKTGSATTERLKTVTVPDPLQMTIGRGGSSIFATDEARLIARAEFLIGQGDVGGARRFLERAVEGHSARAAFLLAETYDLRILRTLQVYGVRGDTQRALELYGVASEGGIDKAKERMSALKGAESP